MWSGVDILPNYQSGGTINDILYQKFQIFRKHRFSLLLVGACNSRGTSRKIHEVVYYTTFFILNVVFMSEFLSYSVDTFLKTIDY